MIVVLPVKSSLGSSLDYFVLVLVFDGMGFEFGLSPWLVFVVL
jgi:hypothetical protein